MLYRIISYADSYLEAEALARAERLNDEADEYQAHLAACRLKRQSMPFYNEERLNNQDIPEEAHASVSC